MGYPVPWQAVLERTYEDWTRPHLVIDTAKKSIEEVTEELLSHLRKNRKRNQAE
jgi:adenylylsulfate kinase-like enzyme